MKTIVVAGKSSKIGKTTLACSLIEMFSGFSALKTTIVHSGGCPRDNGCGICHKLDMDYKIVQDEETINQEGKDTQRFKKAGAAKVVWLVAKENALDKALKKTGSLFNSHTKGLIIEGTSVLKHIRPDLTFYIKK